jgi:amylosucrase
MYWPKLHNDLNIVLSDYPDIWKDDSGRQFALRLAANTDSIKELFREIYGHRDDSEVWFRKMLHVICKAHNDRPAHLRDLDASKMSRDGWFLSSGITGMSLYVDRFCGSLKNLEGKLDYFEELGVNFLHLMPLMMSPEGESDGGYAVSDFRNVDPRFGTIDDLRSLDDRMKERGKYLMLDIVLNHTSHHHDWARRASEGDETFQGYYYMYDDRQIPDLMEETMPDVFPHSSPGSFTYDRKSGKWVMTVFNYYQWDLNFTNPAVFAEMLDTIFFYANLGVDLLRIDAPAFIWKQAGTTCQNLPQAHTLLRLIKHCVQASTPGMALLGEAIVAPKEIMKYFGSGRYSARECDVAYNATHMALQWDALATGDTGIMMEAQPDILRKPIGTTWITYTRCHDDIGLGYSDEMIAAAGYDPGLHRNFIKDYYSGIYQGSPAMGSLFGFNPKTNDARISGSLASLCGLEYGQKEKNKHAIKEALEKILLMQAHSLLLGGIPMLFYGDEAGYTNDYSYLEEEGKSYDNRWMHRPVIDWKKNAKRKKQGTPEQIIFSGTQKLIGIRSKSRVFDDQNNLFWTKPYNIHIAGYVRYTDEERVYCLFNFSGQTSYLDWNALLETGLTPGTELKDLWSDCSIIAGKPEEFLIMHPYSYMIILEKIIT